MKKTRQSKAKAREEASVDMTRTEALLAQLLLHHIGSGGQQKKALVLRSAGFSNVEIAKLMETTAAVVGQVLYQARRGRGKKAGKSKRTKKRGASS